MIKRRTRRGIILLALLAVLSWLLSRPSAEGPANSLSELDTRLNYALYDFSGRMLDDQGRIQLEIESPVLRNDAESGVGTVETPQLRIQQGDDRWYITAESAQVTADRELVSLRGEVSLVRRNDATGQQLDISTRDVLLNVTPRTASTQAAVRIQQSGDRLDAKGMKLDMIANHFELLDDVQAYYEVP
ncbi:MAG: LPS export ABC transporter periplasmic protein LptC [Gammaproteobacteria bacterium]|nr:LPS export ABC transporter periplasmic protein LptC [Gammaproteobacteria bacterium]